MDKNKIILEKELKNFIKQIFNENFNKNEIINIINRAYKYKIQVLDLKYPHNFLDNQIKHYTQENYEKDLKDLKNFDINLLWNKSFWGLGISNSISAIATEPYTKLRKLLNL